MVLVMLDMDFTEIDFFGQSCFLESWHVFAVFLFLSSYFPGTNVNSRIHLTPKTIIKTLSPQTSSSDKLKVLTVDT